jgi:hypothetical protein
MSWNTKLKLSSKDGIFETAYAAFGHTWGICMFFVEQSPMIHPFFFFGP